ncbi:MAG: MFS transporter [Acidobacteria bacterium]|nr:MFS transporter [Acidobacteriota bacterium]MCI0623515.1 MFS transporter [Acidobacteriota bacterium]MCI0724823.1 MFS transporter [Acidobacteriota bacterium]
MAPASLAKNLASFFALNRNTSILLAALVSMGFAEELWMRFLPKYLESLGAAVWAIGLFDAIKTWIGAVYAYPGGLITDRWGLRKALSFFTLLSVAGYSWLLLSPHWAGVLLSSFLFLSWTSFSLPATFSLIGSSLVASQHAMGIGVQATLKRIPIILGPIAGGMLMDHFGIIRGTRLGVMAAVALASLTIAVQWQIQEAPGRCPTSERISFWRSARSFSLPLRRLLLSDILVRFCERIPYAWVILYAMNDLGLTATQFGILTGIEMATAIACLIPVAYLSDRYGREPFIIATFVFFTLFPVSLFLAHSFRALAVAFVIRGLKEFGETARKSLIIQLSPEPRRGQTIGTYYLIRDCLATGAAFLGAALWNISPQTNFIGAAAVGTAGTLLYAWTARRTPPNE